MTRAKLLLRRERVKKILMREYEKHFQALDHLMLRRETKRTLRWKLEMMKIDDMLERKAYDS